MTSEDERDETSTETQESILETPIYNLAFQAFFNETEYALTRSSSDLLSSIPSRKFRRLPRMISGGGHPGTGLEHSAVEIVIDGTVKRDSIEGTDIEAFEVAMYDIATSVAEQTSKALYKTLSDATDATGQTIKSSKETFLSDVLRSLEQVDWEWDEEAQTVRPPQLHLSPDMAEQFKDAVAADPEFESRVDKLAKRKHRDYLANRRSRRIRHQARRAGLRPAADVTPPL